MVPKYGGRLEHVPWLRVDSRFAHILNFPFPQNSLLKVTLGFELRKSTSPKAPNMSSSNSQQLLRTCEAANADDWDWMVNRGPDYLLDALPTENERQEFIEYVSQAYGESPPPVTKGWAWLDMVTNTNFRNEEAIGDLADLFQRPTCPYIELGHHRDIAYRLVPDTQALKYSAEPLWNDTRFILPETIIGVNLDNNPHHHPPKNMATSTVTERTTHGFVCFQLGPVEWYNGDRTTMTPEQALNSAAWKDTGFVAVAKIGEDGRSKEIYLLFNFYYEDEDFNKIHKTDCGNSCSLPNRNEWYTCSRIATSMSGLGEGKQFDVRAVTVDNAEVEIVATVEDQDGNIIRQHI